MIEPTKINDALEPDEWTQAMQNALEEVSEAVGNESWDYTSNLIVQYEAKYPGFSERAQELVDVYEKLNPAPAKKSGSMSWPDVAIAACITAGLAWFTWLLFLYSMAKAGKS